MPVDGNAPPTTLYEVRSYALSNGKLHSFGSTYDLDEAHELLQKRFTGDSAEWAQKYHRDWHVAEVDVTGAFVIPSRPTPRERFTRRNTPISKGDGRWSYQDCEAIDTTTDAVVAKWQYRFSGRPPFEPFRQGDRNFALMSEDYVATSVIDLQTGEVVAAEPTESFGFCPVGFYVPDWWDVHDGSIKPGSSYWDADDEVPDGSYGFVWGCIWGDDTSWKLQYLDLSKVQDGVIARDDRFGYVELATIGDDPTDFIQVWDKGRRITVATLQRFNLDGTQP